MPGAATGVVIGAIAIGTAAISTSITITILTGTTSTTGPDRETGPARVIGLVKATGPDKAVASGSITHRIAVMPLMEIEGPRISSAAGPRDNVPAADKVLDRGVDKGSLAADREAVQVLDRAVERALDRAVERVLGLVVEPVHALAVGVPVLGPAAGVDPVRGHQAPIALVIVPFRRARVEEVAVLSAAAAAVATAAAQPV